MRPQPDQPDRPSRGRRFRRGRPRLVAGRGRAVLASSLFGLIVLLVSLRGLASFYTDLLWFRSLGLGSVYNSILGAKLTLTAVGTLVFFGLCWGSLTVADRIAPTFRPSAGDDDLIERYHAMVGRRAGAVRWGVSLFLSLVVGLSLGGAWNEWVLFRNRVDFGVKDATFHTDVGFFVFQLPFLTTVVAWLFSALVLVLIMTLMAHVVNGGIRFQSELDRVTPQVKAHVSVLLAVLALVKGGQYWLDRYQLTFSTRGTVDGALYVDSNVKLRAIYLLIMISLFAFGLFIANIWRRGWVLPVMAAGLWFFVSTLAGGIVPALVQRGRVDAGGVTRYEKQYLSQNIAATRRAYGLGEVKRVDYDFAGDLEASDLREDASSLESVRLWDPLSMEGAFSAEQDTATFYGIGDVDIDRYELDGEQTPVMVAVRELNTANVPQKAWEATHLVYTHGYGVVAAPADAKTRTGGPRYVSRDVPVETSSGLPEVTRPEIYFGEGKSGYVIVDTDVREIDYEDQNQNQGTVTSRYDGKDGIEVGSGLTGLVRKAAVALRFGDLNPLISGSVNADSKVLIERDVTARVQAVAPFLRVDHDPYPVVLGGRVVYVVDGYTTTSHYPNAQRADTGGLEEDSGLAGASFNYVRNSVKAVVDAYDGTVTLYVSDPKDPIIRAYRKAFPDLFTPLGEAPKKLRDHFRYPEDLFTVQSQMWGRYNVTGPVTFFNKNQAWTPARDAGETDLVKSDSSTTTTSTTVPASSSDGPTPDDRVTPQYLLMTLPGDTEPQFVLVRPFVVFSKSGKKVQSQLKGFMVARSDPGQYGKLETFEISGEPAKGPVQAADAMQSDDQVGALQRDLCDNGSQCSLRNLVMVPVGNSFLYVWSVFVTSSASKIPKLERVIVAYQTADGSLPVAVDESLRGALVKLFGDDVPAGIENSAVSSGGPDPSNGDGEDPEGTTSTTTPGGTTVPGGDETLSAAENALLAKLLKAFDEADAAAKAGDQVAYAEKIVEARGYAAELAELRDRATSNGSGNGSGGPGSGGTSGSTPTTTAPKRTTTTTTPARTTTTTAGA
jgi:uncharacterized membrane protein (UPF0182 family)